MQALCPVAKVAGRHVPLTTVRHLVRSDRGVVIDGSQSLFCDQPDCDVKRGEWSGRLGYWEELMFESATPRTAVKNNHLSCEWKIRAGSLCSRPKMPLRGLTEPARSKEL
ncbi:MAG: hypothetical protein HYX75_13800 [Acidobacteria bacterium]|nr:hypothetical protein [Acidobacteriota bacterium]